MVNGEIDDYDDNDDDDNDVDHDVNDDWWMNSDNNNVFTSEAFAAIKVEAAVKQEGNTER